MISLENLKYVAIASLFVFSTGMFSLASRAQESSLLPATTLSVDAALSMQEETHPPLRLTPDISRILTIDEPVERVIIGNDTHMNILMDTATRLIIVPRNPGATHFTLLGTKGKIIMQRHVIIASPQEKYIRIRRPCPPGSDGCQSVRMFYCPGMCHEISMSGSGSSGNTGTTGIITSGNNNENDNSTESGSDNGFDESAGDQ
ncbi:MAG: hypothetical protein CO093_10910 [Alphaproteobacteria bacterium CG_4_9_14_3_um_filter_47_13]|nr:MAG: hypothetical protein CO093_10910 [Alphaproteobacteria bacterium CG_4_9_14_3_um_filter_47_13]